MTESNAQSLLAAKLCPWLAEPLERCSAAVASERLGHAWLIHGIGGVGKVNLAFALARRLLTGDTATPRPITPDELVSAMSARRELQNHHPDLHYVFPEEDKQTIGIEQIRAVIEALTLKSFAGSGKIVIIEPAEAMTVAAANALLKTLEQPTAGSYLLLVSHCPGRLPATIRSRCQRLAVRRPATSEILAWACGGARGSGEELGELAPSLSPLELAQAIDSEQESAYAAYARDLAAISDGSGDPITIADAWAKRDTGHALDWLARRLQLSIRARLVARGSTPVTESDRHELHTGQREGLSLRSSFDQLAKTEALRNQLGGGINAQLALRVLLLGFRPQEKLK